MRSAENGRSVNQGLCPDYALHEPRRAGHRQGVFKALVASCPDRTLAGWGKRFRIAIHGVNLRTNRNFIWHMFHARPVGGACIAGDGWPTVGEGQAAGGIKFGSIEVAETRFPLFFKRHEFRPDSGGAGKFRGGVGSVLELRVETTTPAKANTAGEGVKYPPYGLLGGKDGLPHRYRLLSKKNVRVVKTKEVGIPVMPGDVFFVESSGGGGYGDPKKRDPRRAGRPCLPPRSARLLGDAAGRGGGRDPQASRGAVGDRRRGEAARR